MTLRLLILASLLGCAGPAQMQRTVAELSPALEPEAPEPDDETAVAVSSVEEAEPILVLPTTGHLQLGDHTARQRRLFGVAPRLMTPWDVSLAERSFAPLDLELVVRYADLEPGTGPSVSQYPLQHRSLVLGLRPDPRDLQSDER
jgi:hypothetical protein